MKKSMLAVVLGFVLCTTMYAENPDELSVPAGLGRGISNVLMCWWEFPRGIVYEFQNLPVAGLAWGPVKGLLLTAGRGTTGAMDLVSLGTFGNWVHNSNYPSFFWETPWVPVD